MNTIPGIRWIENGRQVSAARALGIMDAKLKSRGIVDNGTPSLGRAKASAKDGQSLEEQHGKGVTGGVAGLAVSQSKTNTTGKTGPRSEFDTASLKGLITQLESVMKLVRGSARDTAQRKTATKDAAAIRNEAYWQGVTDSVIAEQPGRSRDAGMDAYLRGVAA